MNWMNIKGFEHYLISDQGIVKSTDRVSGKRRGVIKGQQITPACSKGYMFVALYSSKKKKQQYVHRLVAQHFIPNPYNKPWVNHKNGIKHDNRLSNLEWSTISENHQHSYKYLGRKGLRRPGELNPNSKVSNKQARRISFLFFSKKKSAKELAIRFGLSYSYVYSLVRKEYAYGTRKKT